MHYSTHYSRRMNATIKTSTKLYGVCCQVFVPDENCSAWLNQASADLEYLPEPSFEGKLLIPKYLVKRRTNWSSQFEMPEDGTEWEMFTVCKFPRYSKVEIVEKNALGSFIITATDDYDDATQKVDCDRLVYTYMLQPSSTLLDSEAVEIKIDEITEEEFELLDDEDYQGSFDQDKLEPDVDSGRIDYGRVK